MEVAMKTNGTKTLWTVVAAAVVLVAGAPAASAQDRVTATVPFNFVVGKAQMPAGDYIITEDSGWSVVNIAGQNRRSVAFALTMGGSTNDSASQPELVFDKIGDTYFLERIVIDRDNVRELPLTPAMKARAAEHVAVVLKTITHAG
jgi:hypothetical protein